MTRYAIQPNATYLHTVGIAHLPVGLRAYSRYLESVLYNASNPKKHHIAHRTYRQACRVGVMQ